MSAAPIGAAEDLTSRGRILATALQLFARSGYDGVSLQDIATAVGMRKASLFYHFASKQEIWRAALADELWQIVDLVRPLDKDVPPSLEKLVAVVTAVAEHFAEQPEVARVLLAQLLAPDTEKQKQRISPPTESSPSDVLFLILAQWLSRARTLGVIRRVSIRQMLFDLVGLITFYPAAARELPEAAGPEPFSRKARETRKRELATIVCRMLAPQVDDS